jgi:hypothetical protein
MAIDDVQLYQKHLEKDISGIDVRSDLTASSSKKIQNQYYCSWSITKSWIEKI